MDITASSVTGERLLSNSPYHQGRSKLTFTDVGATLSENPFPSINRQLKAFEAVSKFAHGGLSSNCSEIRGVASGVPPVCTLLCNEMAGDMPGVVKKSCNNWQAVPEKNCSVYPSCHRPFSGQNGSGRNASCAANGCFRKARAEVHVG